jgi:TPR repeat protein
MFSVAQSIVIAALSMGTHGATDAPASATAASRPAPTAVRTLVAQAEQGDRDAMFRLAVAYQNGRGVAEDDLKAVELYRKAAAKGDARAMANLGVMYSRGEGVAKDDSAAIAWYTKAAEAGSAKAMVMLGSRAAQERGDAQSQEEATRWYRKAAERISLQPRFFALVAMTPPRRRTAGFAPQPTAATPRRGLRSVRHR